MRTTFVVLTYNRSDALLAVLRSLAPQCGGAEEVVIADDGSQPQHVAALKAGLPPFACRVRHVWHPDVGFTAARARNLGAREAAGDYLVFLDGDCIPAKAFVQMHLRLAQEGYFVNGSRVLLSEGLTRSVLDGGLDLGRWGLPQWLRARAAGDVNKLSHLLRWPGMPGRDEAAFRWKGIRSCNFGVWKKDFADVNGFDETFSGWGHEDADLVLRLHHLGRRRRNGHLATEVLHLWHRENSRTAEETNRNRVVGRLESGIIRAEAGLAEAHRAPHTLVAELNG